MAMRVRILMKQKKFRGNSMSLTTEIEELLKEKAQLKKILQSFSGRRALPSK